MKYSQFRIALLTFVLGIVSVPFFNTQYHIWTEIPVDLPQVVSDAPIIVILPTERRPFRMGGGGGSSGCECGSGVCSCETEKSVDRVTFERSRGKKARHIPSKASKRSGRFGCVYTKRLVIGSQLEGTLR